MPNITLSIEEKLLTAGRQYAKRHHTSLNNLIRRLLNNTVTNASEHALDDCFTLMDRAGGDSRGDKWTRRDLYDG